VERKFTVNYQPKLDLDAWAVSGAEALLRWPGEHQNVPPSVFVPILESLGLIHDVGEWVILKAMTDAANWATRSGFRVAVNVSPLQLNREDFAENVLAAIADIGADPARLELEVTESMLMADPRRASASLSLLRDAGISIAIDDFGTGHSSLRMLAGLPIDVLKIDRSFVRDLASNRNHRLIVQTTISLAQSLGLKTVAEGVETVEQLCMLRDLGCSSVQGYLLSRPVTANALVEWLAGEQLKGLHEAILDAAGPPVEPLEAAPRTLRG
jgi:EAL domain-containing protein (putative c-di-GMP-specific phosphodiesterase class I)